LAILTVDVSPVPSRELPHRLAAIALCCGSVIATLLPLVRLRNTGSPPFVGQTSFRSCSAFAGVAVPASHSGAAARARSAAKVARPIRRRACCGREVCAVVRVDMMISPNRRVDGARR